MNPLKTSIKGASIAFLLLTIFSSCYSNLTRELEREVRVTIKNESTLSIENTGNSNFTGAYTQQELLDKYLGGMRSEFSSSKIIIDNTNPEFEIRIGSYTIKETTSTETVNDSTSAEHGKTYELTSIDLVASGSLINTETGERKNWTAMKDKSEKVTNSRSAGQIIGGDNKDNTSYREKELDADVASDLSWKCGRRSGASVVKEIYRALK